MEVKHTVKTRCRFCKMEFDSFNLNKVCNDCEAHMDEYFRTLRAYIYENPDYTVMQICEALDIPVALVKYFLKEERLLIKSKGANYFLKCEECGKPIHTGRFCADCEIKALRDDIAGKRSTSLEYKQMDRAISEFHSRKGSYTLLKEKIKN